MKHKTFAIIGALALCLVGVGSTVYGFGEPVEGKCLTEQEAAKIQPPPKGGYPVASTTDAPGVGVSSTVVTSPYNSSHKIDCSKCSRGSLVLDPLAKKVFKKP
jgi:hypothetical protein